MAEASAASFEGWAILELMGHRRLAGYVSEELVGGSCMIRLDIPGPKRAGEVAATQFYSPSALYCLTPTTEELARQLAEALRPVPVHRWELSPPPEAEAEEEPPDGYELEELP
jgi:hypothetical protein